MVTQMANVVVSTARTGGAGEFQGLARKLGLTADAETVSLAEPNTPGASDDLDTRSDQPEGVISLPFQEIMTDRPANQQWDMRVQREVTFAILAPSTWHQRSRYNSANRIYLSPCEKVL